MLQEPAKKGRTASSTALFQLHWKRIVLDEGHTIRNPKSQSSIGCSSLSAGKHLCMLPDLTIVWLWFQTIGGCLLARLYRTSWRIYTVWLGESTHCTWRGAHVLYIVLLVCIDSWDSPHLMISQFGRRWLDLKVHPHSAILCASHDWKHTHR